MGTVQGAAQPDLQSRRRLANAGGRVYNNCRTERLSREWRPRRLLAAVLKSGDEARMNAIDDLFALAMVARGRAYAPYSRFQVGAALRTESGAVFLGCNVENAAFPLGVCAETSAISAMIGAGES